MNDPVYLMPTDVEAQNVKYCVERRAEDADRLVASGNYRRSTPDEIRAASLS